MFPEWTFCSLTGSRAFKREMRHHRDDYGGTNAGESHEGNNIAAITLTACSMETRNATISCDIARSPSHRAPAAIT